MSRGRGRRSTLRSWRARLRGEWYRIRFVRREELQAAAADTEPDADGSETKHTEELRGLCVRDDTRREILVLDGLRGREELDTLIHEMTHACQWDLCGEAVEQIATDMATALWAGGWRRTRK